ncbi:DUF1801 domain-containing protein [Seonamhaeicola algicola]|uniref:DUF1801 domain-containing protein n=1 Tax=Seonamhaeicola algicola TaxID=1719036 RepID=A0A5C7B5B6_9FLAO|nr:DUF1801 domain-containing protein [Seonamhaeicola algicola]TXE15103.1 DUF1801 domain-containing protein [Seonamhaeicola algicola]
MKLITNKNVGIVFNSYPEHVKPKMDALREFIIDVAKNIEEIDTLEETLKWGEPSYITKHGSTLRIDWKAKTPNTYHIYFQCNSKLVTTFRLLYKNMLNFNGNRAIVLNLNDTLPKTLLKPCIVATLTYHKVKHLPFLGI